MSKFSAKKNVNAKWCHAKKNVQVQLVARPNGPRGESMMCASVSERGARELDGSSQDRKKKEPKGPDKGSEQGAGLGRPGWDMDTVGWDAKGDWGCSRAAEKDKKAPAAPPALSFLVFRLPVSQTLLGAFGVGTHLLLASSAWLNGVRGVLVTSNQPSR